MLLLTSTTDRIKIVLDETGGNIFGVATYADRNQTTGAIGAAGRQLINIGNGNTGLVDPPAATTTRNVKTIHVRNAHATVTMTVHIQYDANGTIYELYCATLKAGESLSYSEGIGWKYEPLLGVAPLNVKVVMNRGARAGSSGLRFSELTSQIIPGLSVRVMNNRTYNFLAHITHLGGSATTNGLSFQFLSSRTSDNGAGDGTGCTSAVQIGEIGVVTTSVTAATLEAGAASAEGFFNNGVGTSDTSVRQLTILSGWFTTNADGFVNIYGSAEADLLQAHLIHDGCTWLHVWEPTG